MIVSDVASWRELKCEVRNVKRLIGQRSETMSKSRTKLLREHRDKFLSYRQ